MACVAIHSHLLVSILTIYAMIVILLLQSGLWDMSPSIVNVSETATEHHFNFDGFKVMSSLILHFLCFLCVLVCLIANNVKYAARVIPPIVIITVMVFNSIFNAAACAALWFHHAPGYPCGYSRAIQGGAVMSTVSLVHNIIIIATFCYRSPSHPSLRASEEPNAALPTAPKVEEKEDSKEKEKEPQGPLGETKKPGKGDEKQSDPNKPKEESKAGSKEQQEPSGPGKGSTEDQATTNEAELKKSTKDLKMDKAQHTKHASAEKTRKKKSTKGPDDAQKGSDDQKKATEGD
ncbi:hypothetical protein GCK32_000872 [Trichostrongylus colubriformis]|uniref:Uncharacterized protein n=1 Tax=Trichostrongylus colubriformis TaxID=6319 RepID=A0AAN8F2Q6_TRICO